jgi:hypothetical protein
MYQTDMPVITEVYRQFGFQYLLMLVLAAFFATMILAFGYFVIRDSLRATPSA